MVLSMMIFGILLIIIALILMVKFSSNTDAKYSDTKRMYNEILEYSDVISDFIKELEIIVNSKKNDTSNTDEHIPDIEYNDKSKKSIKKEKSNDMNKNIIELYENGNSIDDIASSLNKGKREVDMIIKLNNLQKKQKNS